MTSRRSFLAGSAALAAGLALLEIAPACSGSATTADPTTGSSDPLADAASDPLAVATAAVYAGLPLVITRRTMQTLAGLAGTNTLLKAPGLGNPTSHVIVAPNHDTVYVLAVLDLTAGPLLLTLPDIPDRYHVVQMIDAWMGGFGLIGTRTTGGRAGSWVIAPAGWQGTPPDGAPVLTCPTPEAVVLGRIRAVDDLDARDAAALGRRFQLGPLNPTSAGSAAAPSLGAPRGTPQSVGDSGAAFFDELGEALAHDPPVTPEQRAAIDAAATLGVGAGARPTAEQQAVLADAMAAARSALAGQRSQAVSTHNGWEVDLSLGTDDTDRGLEARAVIARYFWGPVPAAEAVYPRATADGDGRPLDGGTRYQLRFEPGRQPPVGAFWSVTAYGPDMFLVVNPQNRYSISGQTSGLVSGADGSLELLIQHDPPIGREANWLPVPAGPFSLIMRLYLPGAAILDGSYDYPPVVALGPA